MAPRRGGVLCGEGVGGGGGGLVWVRVGEEMSGVGEG